MDSVVLRAYQELLKVGKITKENIYNHVAEGRITSENYKLITNEECPEMPLDKFKELKIIEINKTCEEAILAGFYSSVKYDPAVLYGFDRDDQKNWTDGWEVLNDALLVGYDNIPDCILKQMLVVDAEHNVIGILAKAKSGTFEPHTVAQYRQLVIYDAGSHKAGCLMKASMLKNVVSSALTEEEMDSATW